MTTEQPARPLPSGPGLLVLPARYTASGALLAQAAEARGMVAEQLPPCRTVPEWAPAAGPAHLYGGPQFAAAVAPRLGLRLLAPTPDWPVHLPHTFTGRTVRRMVLAEARALREPFFAKPRPPAEGTFPADVYGSGDRLPADLPGGLPAQVSEVVAFGAEFRLFLLDGAVRTGSRYATLGRLDPAPLGGCPELAGVLGFAGDLVDAIGHTLPRACVLDVGELLGPGRRRGRWAVVAAGAAWSGHLYASEPDRALDVVLASTEPASGA
ncbi:ATP-grasp domain-containing protein [Streptomyces pathocidini]|uniref:ATP-grasp domain-containing protein n=1 Tax=Streptomyces pathocidini TaxID=1650571 RepID=A0ABW7UWU9_9ACTN|nr:ATP-grasp domain-containing protein [Streptomyces pathocidini]